MSDEKKKKKPGLMARLFSTKKSLDYEEDQEKRRQKEKKLQRMHTVDSGAMAREEPKKSSKPKALDDSALNGKGATAKTSSTKPRPNGTAPKPKPKPQNTQSDGKRRRKKKKKGDNVDIDVSKGLVFPCTPEIILEYHKRKPLLAPNEEWLMVELNEFECLVDSMKIVKIIAKHSKFFEVEPDELWEEFFEWVDEVPAYDEVINYDIWQEFRDKKYPM